MKKTIMFTGLAVVLASCSQSFTVNMGDISILSGNYIGNIVPALPKPAASQSTEQIPAAERVMTLSNVKPTYTDEGSYSVTGLVSVEAGKDMKFSGTVLGNSYKFKKPTAAGAAIKLPTAKLMVEKSATEKLEMNCLVVEAGKGSWVCTLGNDKAVLSKVK